jgi:organic hydroperoxide reductase OsmC/OhrA
MNTVTRTRPTTRPKEYSFPLTVNWLRGRRVAVKVEGKPSCEVAPPTVFKGDDLSAWSPEDLFVAAAASCLAITFTGLAEREGLNYTGLSVEADGVCGMRRDGRFGFTRLQLRFVVETDALDEARARLLAVKADKTCLVSASLDVPVETVINVRPLAYQPPRLGEDRASGEEAWSTIDEREREATSPGTPRLKWS